MRSLTLYLIATCLPGLHADRHNGQHSSVLTVEDLDGDAVREVVVLVRPLLPCRNHEEDARGEDSWEEATSDEPQPSKPRERPPMTRGPALPEPFLLLPRALVLSGASGELLHQFQVGSFLDRGVRALLTLGDVTGDGKPDLVTCSHNRLRILSATDGALGPKIVGRIKDIDIGHNVTVIPDIDGDDCRDLAVHSKTHRGAGSIITLYSSATGRALRFLGRARTVRDGFERPVPPFTRLSVFEEWGERDRVPEGSMAATKYRGRAALAFVAQPWNRRMERDSFELWMVTLDTFEAIYVGRAPGPSWRMASVPDLDGDDQEDLALTRDFEGLRVVDGARGRKLYEISIRSRWMHGGGTSLAVLPDVDGDGLPEILEVGNEVSRACDGGTAKVISGVAGEPLWWIRFPGSVLPTLECEIGIDAAAHPLEFDDGPHGVLLHMPRLAEVWRVDARSGKTLWRVAYKVSDETLVMVEHSPERLGVLTTSDR